MNYNEKQKSLIEAYKATMYTVFAPKIKLIVGQHSADLNTLLDQYKAKEWAYITAWNPFSKILNEQDNMNRHNALLKDLRTFAFFEGEGIGSDPNWLPEKSVLIIGISLKDAIDLGNKYNQNAILVGMRENVSELILLDSFKLI